MKDARTLEKEYLNAYAAHADALFRHATFRLSDREKALDLVQETFCKAWDYLVAGGEIESYKSFLYRSLNNAIIDEYRRKKSTSLDAILEDDETGAAEALGAEGSVREVEETFDETRSIELIRAHIPELPEAYRVVITMRYIDGLSPKEIASFLHLTENVVSVRIHRGIKQLRALCIDL